MVEHSRKILASEEEATTTKACQSYEVHSLQAYDTKACQSYEAHSLQAYDANLHSSW